MGAAENKRSVIVGIFVLLGILIFVAGILLLGGQQKRFGKNVVIKAYVSDAEGLKTGNNVRFSGVKIGTIKEIKFAGDANVEITMNIEIESQKYIHKDAKVKIGSESLIGNKNVVITGGTPSAPAVENGDVLQTEKTLSTEDMMATFQENNKNLVEVTGNLKTVSNGLVKGQGTIGMLLQDSMMAYNFRTTVNSLQQASVTTARATAALAQFTSKLNQKDGLANQLLTDTSVFAQLKASMALLEETTSKASALATNLNQASAKLNSSNNAAGVLLNDPEFANSMKKTMASLETSTAKLDENMEAMQHNFLLRGFFKKRDKEAKEAQEGKK